MKIKSKTSKSNDKTTNKKIKSSNETAFGSGAARRAAGASVSRLLAGRGRSLADLVGQKEKPAVASAIKPKSARPSRQSSAMHLSYDPEEEEIRYLQQKLGISSTDDISEDSKFIRELKMDGMGDLFDIVLPEIASGVAKGKKKVAKFKDRLSAAVARGSLSDSDFSEEEFPVTSLGSDIEENDNDLDDDYDDYDDDIEEPEVQDVEEEESLSESADSQEEESSVQTKKKLSIKEVLDQRAQLRGQKQQIKVDPSKGLRTLEIKEKQVKGKVDRFDIISTEESEMSNESEDSDSEEEGFEAKSGNEEVNDEDEDAELDEDEDEDEAEDEMEASDEDDSFEEHKSQAPKRPDVFGRDISEQNRKKGEGATLLTTQTPLAQILSNESSGVGKYIPPHLRRKLAAEGVFVDASGRAVSSQMQKSDDPKERLKASANASSTANVNAGISLSDSQVRLRQAVTSILNKITSDNADAMQREISKLITLHSRGDVIDALCFCTITMIISQPRILPAIITAIAGIVTYYHRKEGTHVGSLFMEKTVREIDAHLGNPVQLRYSNPNAAPHLIVLLCSLYQFKVVSAQLVIDMLSAIVNKCEIWNEAVTLLHRGLQYAGLAVRKEEPGLLKDLILAIQKRVKAESSGVTGGHERFMLEALSNVRNNKPTTEDNERENLVKSLVKWLEKENATNERQLAVTWDDILNADEAGRWWLVGAAFKPTKRGSHENLDGQTDSRSRVKLNQEDEATDGFQSVSEDALTRAAVAQGMNTNVRRAVFSIVMGSSDFLEAYEKLTKLNLSSQQLRQAVRVIFHCCAQEQAFNPYYGAILSKLCDGDKATKFTVQLVLWDILKEWKSQNESSELQTSVPRQVNNIGRMIALCVEYHSLPLTVLKQLDFDNLEPTDLLFLQALFSMLFSRVTSKSELQAISNCVIVKREIDILRNGIRFFIQHYVIRLLKKKKDLQTLAVAKHFLSQLE